MKKNSSNPPKKKLPQKNPPKKEKTEPDKWIIRNDYKIVKVNTKINNFYYFGYKQFNSYKLALKCKINMLKINIKRTEKLIKHYNAELNKCNGILSLAEEEMKRA